MSENNDPGPEVPQTPATPEAEAPAKRTFRDRLTGTRARLRGTRGLIAATLAALIVGGIGGAAIHAAVDGDRHEHGRHFGERGPGDLRNDFDRRAPRGVPGRLSPTRTPSPSPSESPSESSDS